jgi:PilZ domain
MADKGRLRRHHRIETRSIVQLVWKDQLGNEKYTKARALDVSESGMRVEVPERIPERSYITFRADELSLHGTGSVRSCQGKGLKYIVGLEFSTGMKWKPTPPKSEPAETIETTSDEVETQTVFR